MRRWFLALSVLVALAPPARAQTFGEGLSAYNSGDFTRAIRIWYALAERGEPSSQAGLGFLFYKGLGVPSDYGEAHYWFEQAAKAGQPEGQLLLGTLYFFGHGVPRNFSLAFIWCELASGNGQADADECRNVALESMTPAEMSESFKRVAEMRRTMPKLAR
jgi:TPR repeat protein